MLIRYETEDNNFTECSVYNGEEFETRITERRAPWKQWRIIETKYCCDQMKEQHDKFSFDMGLFGFYHFDIDADGTEAERIVPIKLCPWCGEEVTIVHVQHIREEPIIQRVHRKTLVYSCKINEEEEDAIVAVRKIVEANFPILKKE